MEKKERTKYYPISVKDKKLHNDFMVFGKIREDKNVDETLRYLLKTSDDFDIMKGTIIDALTKLKEDVLNYPDSNYFSDMYRRALEVSREVLSEDDLKYIDEVAKSNVEYEVEKGD